MFLRCLAKGCPRNTSILTTAQVIQLKFLEHEKIQEENFKSLIMVSTRLVLEMMASKESR